MFSKQFNSRFEYQQTNISTNASQHVSNFLWHLISWFQKVLAFLALCIFM